MGYSKIRFGFFFRRRAQAVSLEPAKMFSIFEFLYILEDGAML